MLLTWFDFLLEKVTQFGSPRDVAGVVERGVEVLVPRRLGQRHVRPEGFVRLVSHGAGAGLRRLVVESLESHRGVAAARKK